VASLAVGVGLVLDIQWTTPRCWVSPPPSTIVRGLSDVDLLSFQGIADQGEANS
jgi:hypothetical protein